jgi:mannitol/fructose-specific phosphotransferase system IIA component (Ntr-type)
MRAIECDTLDPELADRLVETNLYGVLALTDNWALNRLACRHVSDSLHIERAVRWVGREEEDEPAAEGGSPIWWALRPPSAVSALLAQGNARFLRYAEADAAVYSKRVLYTPLLRIRNGTVEPIASPAALSTTGDDTVVVLQRDPTGLDGLMVGEPVFFDRVDHFETLLQRLVEVAASARPELDVQSTLDRVIERERAFPTVIGGGVSMPHALCDPLDEAVCVVGVVRPPQEGAEEANPIAQSIRVVFLIISPEKRPQAHLSAISAVARFAADARRIEALIAAPDPATARTICVTEALPTSIAKTPGSGVRRKRDTTEIIVSSGPGTTE